MPPAWCGRRGRITSIATARQRPWTEKTTRRRRDFIQFDNCMSEIFKILLCTVDKLPVHEVCRYEIHTGRHYQRSKPCKDVAQMPIDAKKMMLSRAHRNNSNRLRRQRLER